MRGTRIASGSGAGRTRSTTFSTPEAPSEWEARRRSAAPFSGGESLRTLRVGEPSTKGRIVIFSEARKPIEDRRLSAGELRELGRSRCVRWDGVGGARDAPSGHLR